MLLARRVSGITPYLRTIDTVRNWSSLVVATVTYPLFLAGYTDLCSSLVLFYFFIDTPFVSSWDILIHHLAAVTITASCYAIRHHPASYAVIAALFKTELSTIFLTLVTLSQQRMITLSPKVESLLKYCFMAAFLKFRTWDFTVTALQVRPLQIMDETGHYSPFEVPLGYVGVLVVLGLNAYWTVLILKRGIRMLRRQGIREIKSS